MRRDQRSLSADLWRLGSVALARHFYALTRLASRRILRVGLTQSLTLARTSMEFCWAGSPKKCVRAFFLLQATEPGAGDVADRTLI